MSFELGLIPRISPQTSQTMPILFICYELIIHLMDCTLCYFTLQGDHKCYDEGSYAVLHVRVFVMRHERKSGIDTNKEKKFVGMKTFLYSERTTIWFFYSALF